jgi:polyketide cyclase/dehydrase/lipid transport protein
MLIIKHTVETSAPASAIWHVWQDVSNWNTWDPGIEYSTSNGPFEAGTTGTLKPKGGPLVRTKLTCVEPPCRGFAKFVDEAKLPLARIIVTHTLNELKEKTLVTHHIEMSGILAFLFAFIIGRDMKKNLPQEMLAMVRKAEILSKKE